MNGKGFKVPRGVGVIQGDGINYRTIRALLEAVLEAGFSAQVRRRSSTMAGVAVRVGYSVKAVLATGWAGDARCKLRCAWSSEPLLHTAHDLRCPTIPACAAVGGLWHGRRAAAAGQPRHTQLRHQALPDHLRRRQVCCVGLGGWALGLQS